MMPTIAGVIWLTVHKKDWQSYCNGWNIHNICIVSSGDLHRLDYKPHTRDYRKNQREHFFHNKYFMERDSFVMDCLEKELLKRNVQEFEEDYQMYMNMKKITPVILI